MDEHTEPDATTIDAEHAEEGAAHTADREPTAAEEAAAEGYQESDEERQQVERGRTAPTGADRQRSAPVRTAVPGGAPPTRCA
jgi:hypothetical protein